MLSLPREAPMLSVLSAVRAAAEQLASDGGKPRHSQPGLAGPLMPAAYPQTTAPRHSTICRYDCSHPEPIGIRADVSSDSKQLSLRRDHLPPGPTGPRTLAVRTLGQPVEVRSPSVFCAGLSSHTHHARRRQRDVSPRYFLAHARPSAISSTISSIVRTRTVLLCSEFRNFFP